MSIFGHRGSGRHGTEDGSGAAAGQHDHDADDYDAEGYEGEYVDDEYPDDEDTEDTDTEDTEEREVPDSGPYDEEDAPDDGMARIDLGSVRVPLPEGAQLQVEMDPAGPLKAVHPLTQHGRLTISAYAAPRTGKLWPEINRELADQLSHDAARVRREIGEWGTEVVALDNDLLYRFIGIDGPRWLLRGMVIGPKDRSAAAAALLRDVIRESVVVRGKHPMPAREPLPVQLPQEVAEQIEQLQAQIQAQAQGPAQGQAFPQPQP